ncbi:polysialyltransferase family glycosyltransferase [Halomonas sp. BC2]|uniref:polysialyltransferase family glycosyltransferase n=1 Tax=Halomonas sp. BC2 TaxID=1670449 RepID=UPI00111BB217|nr:polysialyltransferase family glycosyltransferase [Halomonas sp. BC2]
MFRGNTELFQDFFPSFLARLFFKNNLKGNGFLYLGHHTYFKPSVLSFFENALFGKCVRTFSFEEGIGSYHNLSQEREVARREGKRFYLARFFFEKKFLSSRWLIDCKWGLLSQRQDEKVRYWHQAAVSELAFNVYKQSGECNDAGDSVLYFTSPLVELGLITARENKELMIKIKNFFLDRGKVLKVKPHPLDRQPYQEMLDSGCVVVSQAPAEVHLSKFRYAAVAGMNSGALLTASIMFGCQAVNFQSCLPSDAKSKLVLCEELESLFFKYTVDYEDA